MRKLIIKLLTKIGLRFKKRSYHDAVKKADDLYKKTGQKCMVFYTGGEFKVVTKQSIRSGKRKGYFKGLDYAEIEKRAMYVAGSAHVDHSKLKAKYLKAV